MLDDKYFCVGRQAICWSRNMKEDEQYQPTVRNPHGGRTWGYQSTWSIGLEAVEQDQMWWKKIFPRVRPSRTEKSDVTREYGPMLATWDHSWSELEEDYMNWSVLHAWIDNASQQGQEQERKVDPWLLCLSIIWMTHEVAGRYGKHHRDDKLVC